ncbi:S1 family peptidase [Intrasporangium sp. DVR]|uniref:S1 family peptidase n=1 Tax=Intrasporangium sp. DVR TaxID=3127867 RepID=UPI00313A5ECA
MRNLYRPLLAAALVTVFAATSCTKAPQDENRGLRPEAVVLLAYANTSPISSADILCSGVVAAGLIITARHCVRDGQRLRVVADPVDLCDQTPDMGTPLTSPWQIPNPRADIAVARATLPGSPRPPTAAGAPGTFVVTGWGTRPGHPIRCTSRTITLKPASGCGDDDTTLCLTGAQENTCTGDSGAGVLDHTGELIAIVTAGNSCHAGAPGTYTRLGPLMTWARHHGLATS